MVFDGGFWFLAIGLWLVALTGFIVYRELQFRRLFRSREGDVRSLLEKLLASSELAQKTIKDVNQKIEVITKKDIRHIQKLGLVRFNPFRDAGGNQSFTLALLNEDNTGIVLTGLHARETTRLYVKDVIRGESRSELSKEEKEAILVAAGRK